MDLPKHLRFARAIALAGAAGAIAMACGGDVDEPSTPAATSGTCIGSFTGDASIACAAGNTCTWNVESGQVACRKEAGAPITCGVITCSSACTCDALLPSTCRCSGGIAGPLLPPDLPSA